MRRSTPARRAGQSPPLAIASRHADARTSTGFMLWQVASLWQRRVRAALEPTGLTHGQFVLLTCAAWLEVEGATNAVVVTQARIASRAKTDAVTTSEVLRTLERKRLIQRVSNPADCRAKIISVTPAGSRLVRRAVPLVEAVDDAFFSAPSPELRQLTELLSSGTHTASTEHENDRSVRHPER